VLSTLEKHVDIADIPRKYGRELDFEFGMPLNLDSTWWICLNGR
jgi:hypothetical protein